MRRVSNNRRSHNKHRKAAVRHCGHNCHDAAAGRGQYGTPRQRQVSNLSGPIRGHLLQECSHHRGIPGDRRPLVQGFQAIGYGIVANSRSIGGASEIGEESLLADPDSCPADGDHFIPSHRF